MEVYNLEGKNISESAKVSGKGSTKESINDGVYGNISCWKSDTKGGGWVQLDFGKPQTINQVIWGRDRTGQYPDRLASDYVIEVATESGDWKKVADSSDRAPFDPKLAKVDVYQVPDIKGEFREKAKQLISDRTPLVNTLKQYHGGKQSVFAAQSNEPEVMHLLNRGDPEQPKGEVVPASLSFLDPVELPRDSNDLDRRKALAGWIADSGNPLTARVAVNRIWQWHFGTGIVATANDFGNLGVLPSHPELLDWLASEFIESGWSVKNLHRIIVLSKAYRQEHGVHSEGLAIDSDVRLLWRFPSRRMEGEVIRDSILAISNQLDLKMYGRGYDLFSSRGGTGGFKPIESHLRKDGRRRMIYAYKVRMEREAVFGAFDCPDAGQSAPRRSQSTTPIQALNLFNSQFTIDLAGDFAKRIQADVGEEPKAQVSRAWQLAMGREPNPDELADAESVVRKKWDSNSLPGNFQF